MGNQQPIVSPVDEAAFDYLTAKQAEEDAREVRISAGQKLIELLGLKDEGTISSKTDYYRIATVGRVNRTIVDAWVPEVRERLAPEVFATVFTPTWKISIGGLNKLAKENPAAYQIALNAISSKPGMPGVTVELLKEVA